MNRDNSMTPEADDPFAATAPESDDRVPSEEPDSEMRGLFGLGKKRKPEGYQHSSHEVGFLDRSTRGDLVPVVRASSVPPDPTLRGARVKITLDAIKLADFPGEGEHQVLFDFQAQAQAPGQPETLHVNLCLPVREGEQGSLMSWPIFQGLVVGPEGIKLCVDSVNLSNVKDESFLTFVRSDVFQQGLSLVGSVVPAVRAVSALAQGIFEMAVTRYRNVRSKPFFLGLSFDEMVMGSRLREGSYVVIQLPEDEVPGLWKSVFYSADANRLMLHREGEPAPRLLPYNHWVLSIARMYEDPRKAESPPDGE